jgi:hypothetical protein
MIVYLKVIQIYGYTYDTQNSNAITEVTAEEVRNMMNQLKALGIAIP